MKKQRRPLNSEGSGRKRALLKNQKKNTNKKKGSGFEKWNGTLSKRTPDVGYERGSRFCRKRGVWEAGRLSTDLHYQQKSGISIDLVLDRRSGSIARMGGNFAWEEGESLNQKPGKFVFCRKER